MTISSFNDDWTVGPKVSIHAALQGVGATGQPVTLPHDALFALERSSTQGEGPNTGHFPGVAFEYRKTFDVLFHLLRRTGPIPSLRPTQHRAC